MNQKTHVGGCPETVMVFTKKSLYCLCVHQPCIASAQNLQIFLLLVSLLPGATVPPSAGGFCERCRSVQPSNLAWPPKWMKVALSTKIREGLTPPEPVESRSWTCCRAQFSSHLGLGGNLTWSAILTESGCEAGAIRNVSSIIQGSLGLFSLKSRDVDVLSQVILRSSKGRSWHHSTLLRHAEGCQLPWQPWMCSPARTLCC